MKPSEQCQHITQTRALFSCPDGVSEIRATKAGPYKNTIYSGYFEALSEEAFLEGIHACAKQKPSAIYVTLNPIHPDALARCANRIDRAGSGDGAKDTEILHRRWILVDADTIRLANISATEEEHTAGIERATAIRDMFLKVYGVATVLADSGNGAHCLIPCILPNDEESKALVIGVLTALQAQFGDNVVKIDTGVFNAARICKAYGTLVRKGDNTELRPHRYAQLIDVPSALPPVSVDILRALAGLAKPTSAKPSAKATRSPVGPGSSIPTFDVPAFLAKHGIPVHHEEEGAMGWHQWALEACPFNPDHRAPDAMVSQQAGTGKVSFKCLHNSCQANKWQEFRKKFEPDWMPYEERTYSSHTKTTRPRTERTDDLSEAEEALHNKTLDKELAAYPLTDSGNAERFAKRNERNVRYCHQWGKWLIWDGTRWKEDSSGEAHRLAKYTARQINAEAATIPVEPKGEDNKPSHKDRLVAWAKKSESKTALTAMLILAQNELDVSVTSDALDTNPWLFNCANGTIDLRSGELRPHNRADLITKSSPVIYDPQAAAPRWESFLERVLPDAEMRSYVQRACGYTLTGSTEEQCLFFLYGNGKNGKSKFTYALEQLLGDYWGKTRAETLMQKRDQGGISNDVAALRSLRLCTVSEVNEGQRLNEALIKDLSGGDTLSARFLHQEFFSFRPNFKILMYGNHKPTIKGTDEGIWRRIRLIPFLVTIPPEERDPNLEKRFDAELSGILQWVVRGCLKWQEKGLQDPATVTDATQAYRQEMDNTEQFLSDRCTKEPDKEKECFVYCGCLYDNYVEWCKVAGEHPYSMRTFGDTMAKKGYSKIRKNKGKQYLGIRLMSSDEQAERDQNTEETPK